MFLKTTSTANNTPVPELLPLPSTNNATYVHARVTNLLGSFYELYILGVYIYTLKLIYAGCTAAYAAPCRTAVSFP